MKSQVLNRCLSFDWIPSIFIHSFTPKRVPPLTMNNHKRSRLHPTVWLPAGLHPSTSLTSSGRCGPSSPRSPCSLTLSCVCVCVRAPLSVGLGVRWPAHPPPVQHAAGQVQEAAGPGEDPTHSVHGQPVHQGELWLPEDAGWRRAHSARRLWRGLCVVETRLQLLLLDASWKWQRFNNILTAGRFWSTNSGDSLLVTFLKPEALLFFTCSQWDEGQAEMWSLPEWFF